MVVDNAKDTLVAVKECNPIGDGPEVVADMDVTGGLDPREGSLPAGLVLECQIIFFTVQTHGTLLIVIAGTGILRRFSLEFKVSREKRRERSGKKRAQVDMVDRKEEVDTVDRVDGARKRVTHKKRSCQ